MEKYTINQKIEESACVACGEPLYIGDTAYQSDSGDITCSRTCCAAVEAIDGGLTCPACDGLTAVLADGQEHANFATPDAARRFVAYMRGERFNK